jgi:sugar lactone lactonase YvrE
LQNRNNQNGPLFDASLSSVALLDFGFKTSNAQKTIRYETRPTYSIIPNQTTVNEFQFGAAGSPDLAIGNTSVYVRPSAGSTPSTNTTSGALIVAGGAGISGNVYAGQIYTTSCKVAIGQNAGVTSQNTQSVAIGNLAAYANQQSYSVAIGVNAGRCFQQTLSVAIGYSAGRCFQGSSTVAIGYCAGRFSQNNQSIAIGNNAAYANQQTYSVAIGYYAGRCFQGASTVAIGYSAGRCSQGASTVAIGQCAGRFSQNTYSVAIGYFAGYSSQNTYSVAIGGSAGQSLQGNQAVAIGYFAAYKCQGCKSLALGYAAGACYQGTQATAIGGCAGRFSQNSYGVAIGSQAAFCRQRTYAVAIGLNAGRVAQGTQSVSIGSCSSTACQGSYSVAIGSFSGKTSQNAYSVAIGFTAGRCLQRTGAVAIGTNAGQVAQGAYAVAIGSNAGQNCQVTKSIAINASCLQLFANNQGLYINPVRNCSANISQAVYYNTTTKELTYAAPSFAIDQTARNLANTTAGGLITANANSFYIQSGLNTANGNISALQGGLIAANANSFYIQSGLNSANANIISLQTKANTLLPNIGSVITINSASQLYVSNNQPGLSSAVGALTVMGGIGAQDNVWIDGNLSITNPIPLIQFTGSNSYVAYTGTNDLTSWDQTPVRYTFTGDNAPQGITFKPDGTVIYIVGTTAPQRVYQLRLNSAWDQSTAINTAAFSVATQDTSPQDIWFKPDGSEMYILGNTNKRVWQYHLNTPWDINTASFIVNSNTAVGQLQTQDSTVTGLTFKPDGTQMYVNGSSNNAVYQYTLSTPWSVNTATYTTNTQVAGITSTQFSALAASSTAHAFNTDGTRMFVAGINTRDIVEFNLSTAWNVATSSYRTRRNVYWEDGGITGMYYTDTANSLYTIGTSFRIIFQYATNGTAAETIANNIVLTGNTTANGSLFVTGNFKVDGPSFFTSTLTQAGAATFNNTLSVSGTLTATGALGLSGAATGGVNLGTSVTTGNFGVGTVLTTGTLLYGGVSQTGNTAFGRSTLTSNLEIANGIVISGNTKTVGIGNYGTTGSSTVINIGVGSLGNTTINFGGNTNPGNTTVNFGQNTNISVLGTLSLSSNIVQNGISSNKVIVRNQPKGTFANLDNISVSVNTGGYPLVSTITGSQQVFWSWEKLSGGITAGSFTGATLSTTQTSIGINSGIGSGGDTVLINLYEQSGNNFYKISCYQMIISTNASIIVERMA